MYRYSSPRSVHCPHDYSNINRHLHDVPEWDGVEIITKIVFNKRKVQTQGLMSEDFKGPEVSSLHRCSASLYSVC